jgi:hypothetical protein
VARRRRALVLLCVLAGAGAVGAGCLPVIRSADQTATTTTTTKAAASTLLPPGAPDPYNDHGKGEFVAFCPVDHRATQDPILAPGNLAFWHEHSFLGNKTTDSLSTLASLMGKATTCDPVEDSAAYWVPTLFDNGTAVAPTTAAIYYRVLPPQDPAKVQPFPPGLKMVAGKATAATAQDPSVMSWTCIGTTVVSETIPDCGGATLELRLHFPECWDGVHLDSADHVSHVAYSHGLSCPPDHPVLVPQLTFQFQYPVSGPGVTLSSDHTMSGADVPGGQTAHGDFVNAWNPAALQQRVTECLHTAIVCMSNGEPPPQI